LKKQIPYFVILIFILISTCFSFDVHLSYKSDAERHLLEKYRLNQLNNEEILKAWLIADGLKDSLAIVQIYDRFDKICTELEDKIDPDDDIDDKAEEIFKFLHKKVFKIPKNKTSLKNLFDNGEYNLLTGSAVYYLICRNFNVPVKLLNSSVYILNQVIDGDNLINVEIIDEKHGFDKKIKNDILVKLFVDMEIIDKEEVDKNGYDFVIDKYFNFYEIMNPFKLMALFYHIKGMQSLESGEFEPALKYYEKALFVNPDNEIFRQNYKASLISTSQILNPISKFLPYFRNALSFLKNDQSFTDFAIVLAKQLVAYYVDEMRDHKRALNLILELKVSYINDKFIRTLSDLEEDIEFDSITRLVSLGNYEEAYTRMKAAYDEHLSIPKYKESYADISKAYVYHLLHKYRDYEKARQIMDTVIVKAGDYPIIQDMYISVMLAPFEQGLRYVESNIKEAYSLAHKAYDSNPQHEFAKYAISRVYHEMAMTKIRENNLIEAHRILVKGLKLVPNDKLLIEDLGQVEEAY
jgi:tetratricopeptide (TPR) repeat protein